MVREISSSNYEDGEEPERGLIAAAAPAGDTADVDADDRATTAAGSHSGSGGVGESAQPPFSAWHESWDILKLQVPIFFSIISSTAMKVTDTALLGHVGTKYLSASALSDLWTMSTGVILQGRVLGIFCSQAVGAGNKQLAGIWMQVSIAVLSIVAVPVVIMWSSTGLVLQAAGESALAPDAAYYAWVGLACIPARIGFSQLSQFFQSQRIMRPTVYVSAIAMLFNLIFGLSLVLGVGIPNWNGFGFRACPWVTAMAETMQLVMLWYFFCHRKKLHAASWPAAGWHTSHITKDRVIKYLRMYIPAALAIASDFWRFAVVGVVAATMGETKLAAFNASYRILWMCLVLVGSQAAAVSIKLGIALGAGKVADAQRSAAVGTAMTLATLVLLGMVLLSFPKQLGQIFSTDVEVLDLFVQSRVAFAAMGFFMTFSVNLEKIPLSMGRTRAVLYAGLIGSWVGQVPAVVICTHFWRDDLVGLYTGVALGYALLCAILVGVIVTSDWEKHAREAMSRSEIGPSTAVAKKAEEDETAVEVEMTELEA